MIAPEPEWRRVPSLDELEASDTGMLRLRRDRGPAISGRDRKPAGYVLPQFNNRGYRSASVRDNDGTLKRRYVHRIVCEAFHGTAPDERPHVNHINAAKADNRPSNLEWASRSENAKHAYGLGLLHTPKRKLTDELAEEIRRRYAAGGETHRSLAKDYCVGRDAIQNIILGLTYVTEAE